MDGDELPFPIGREREAGADVFAGEVGEITQNVLLCHARGQVLEHVIQRDPQSADTRLPPSLPGSIVISLR